MYQIMMDGILVYDPRSKAHTVASATVKQTVNRAGNVKLGLYPENPMYGKIAPLANRIRIFQDGSEIFRGRSLSVETELYGERKVICEGCLAYFNDTIVRPYNYSGTVEGYLQMLIDQHNSQVDAGRKFALGKVDAMDSNDYIVRATSAYPTTMQEIQEKLIDLLGGYLILRYGDVVTIDYLADTDIKNIQDVEFGKNLIDLSQLITGEEIATGILPLGARDQDGNRLTIASVNQGVDYIANEEAVNRYGLILKVMEHDDITLPGNLLRQAGKDLTECALLSETVEVTAVDLRATGQDIQSFRIGRYERVISVPHGLDTYMLVTELDLDLLNPDDSRLTVGRTRGTYTGSQMELQKEQDRELLGIFGEASDAKKQAEEAVRAANASRAITMVLTNEVHAVPTDEDGANGNYTGCETGVSVLYGKEDVTESCSYRVEKSTGVTGQWKEALHVYTVTELSADSGWVDITAVYQDTLAVTRRFSISKVKDGGKGEKGDDAVLLMIDSSNGTIFKNTGVATSLTVSIIIGDLLIGCARQMHEKFGMGAKITWSAKRFGESEYTPIDETDPRLSDEGFIFTLNSEDVEIKTTFHCVLDY